MQSCQPDTDQEIHFFLGTGSGWVTSNSVSSVINSETFDQVI